MARILGGGMFGEMRGKLGSMVFARNRGGAYSRAYAKPVDPRTIAQLAARNNFGSASSNYHSLTPTLKALWQNFANNVFNPKTGTPGVPSGFNAFVSLLNVVNNIKLLTNVEVEAGSSPIVIDEVRPFEYNGNPPTNQLQSNIGAKDSGSINMNFVNATITQIEISDSIFTGRISITMNTSGGGIGPAGGWQNLTDSAGNNFGFKIFMSNPVAQAGMFINNPYQFDIGTFPSISTVAAVDPEPATIFSGDFELNGDHYNALPLSRQVVQLSIFGVSTDGMLLRLGSSFITLNNV